MKEFDEVVHRSIFSYVPAWIRPNHLTILRAVLLVPLILARTSGPAVKVGIVILSSLCDLLDGPLARVRGLKTESGALLDATADKVFILGTLFFVCPDQVPASIRWTVLALDVLLIAVRPFKTRYRITVSANAYGALKCWTQTFGICFVLTGDAILGSLVLPTFLLAIFFAACDLSMHVRDIVRKLI